MGSEQNVVNLISSTPHALQLVAYAARRCKNSVQKSDSPGVLLLGGFLTEVALDADRVLVGPKDRKLIEECILRGHESIFEHPVATFEIYFSRAVQAQMLRHRIAAYSAESSRAVDMSMTTDNAKRFYLPHSIKHDERVIYAEGTAANKFWSCIENCMATYRELIAAGTPVEDARYVLPMALMQPVVATMNIRQWRHVIAERTCKHAQFELRYVIKEIRRVLRNIEPLLVRGAEKYERCVEKSSCGHCMTNWEGMEDDSTKEIK